MPSSQSEKLTSVNGVAIRTQSKNFVKIKSPPKFLDSNETQILDKTETTATKSLNQNQPSRPSSADSSEMSPGNISNEIRFRRREL